MRTGGARRGAGGSADAIATPTTHTPEVGDIATRHVTRGGAIAAPVAIAASVRDTTERSTPAPIVTPAGDGDGMR